MSEGTDIKQWAINIVSKNTDEFSAYLAVTLKRPSVCLHRLPLESFPQTKTQTVSLQSDLLRDRICTSSNGYGCSYYI